MRISFSTLACPDLTMPQIVKIATGAGYDGIELRFVEGEAALWKLAALSGTQLATTKRMLADSGMTIPCVDTSCRFHSPEAEERSRSIAEGERMSDLAAELGAPGIRVFGDTVQPGADRVTTRGWIADSIRSLAESVKQKGVQVWLESHGDFCSAEETKAILDRADHSHVGVVWDPANSFAANCESPSHGAATLGASIRHLHMKDIRRDAGGCRYVLTGTGEFPMPELRTALSGLGYEGYISFEWEKKWHPEIEDAEIALPHFVNWFRNTYERS